MEPVPFIPPPHGIAEVRRVFGNPSFRLMSPPFVDIDDAWERDNLVRAIVPGVGHDRNGLLIRLHKLVMPRFLEAMAAAVAAAPGYEVRMLGGYCARQMKTLDPAKQATAPLSRHANGCAFDINWDTNAFAYRLITDIPEAFIGAFIDHGWEWGGNWIHSKDAMHFQYATGC